MTVSVVEPRAWIRNPGPGFGAQGPLSRVAEASWSTDWPQPGRGGLEQGALRRAGRLILIQGRLGGCRPAGSQRMNGETRQDPFKALRCAQFSKSHVSERREGGEAELRSKSQKTFV